MKKKFFSKFALVLVLGFVMITLSGCETFLEVLSGVSSGMNEASNNFSNEYSSKSESGLYYSFYNSSSHTVTLTDATGTITLYSGGSATGRFNKEATVYNIYYSPSDKVEVSQSGTSFTFSDK